MRDPVRCAVLIDSAGSALWCVCPNELGQANTQEFGAVLPSDDVVFDAVDVVTPTGTCLASKVVCTVPRTENLLVTGPNVSGKSSLFRVLGGLWPIRCGRLLRSGNCDIVLAHLTLACSPALRHPTRTVWGVLLGAQADWVLMGAWDPML